MNGFIIEQNYNSYLEEDHQTWATLCKRQEELHDAKISKEYLSGFNKLQLDKTKIVQIEDLSKQLEKLSGWTLIPVSGLLPTKDFFYMIINKRYPVTVSIRKPHELNFSEQPDIFHDVYGHLPLLTNEKFLRFLTAYSIIAIKYANYDKAVDFLGRLYWFTYEMGLIREDGMHKPYGGAVITSSEEINRINDSNTPKYKFDLDHVFKTSFNPYKLQNEYFIIDSFDDLYNCLQDVESKLLEHLMLPEVDLTLRNYSLNRRLGKGFNNVIGFLNDISFKFPNSISFVAGQPDENFFNIEDQVSKLDLFIDYLVETTNESRLACINKIGQYNKTKGIINDIVAEYLKVDENIHVKADDILMTVGAQEAFSIIVSTICDQEHDVVLVEDPSYIGVSSFAKVFNHNIQGVAIDDEGIDLEMLKRKIIELSQSQKRVKLVYIIPDYQNPSGSCMPVGNRIKLLELAQRYNFLIIEDSVYNSFTYAQKKNPTLKSLDKYNRVLYVGSFSKSLFPGLRIGLIAANQFIENEFGQSVSLVDEMAKIKALLTNNTSTISQAILGGVLLELNHSLSEWSKPKFESYKRKQQAMFNCLDKYIGQYKNSWAEGISWNKPDGGFFIKMVVPFVVENQSVYESAEKFDVIFCPMHYFYLQKGGENEIRLTFSNLSIDDIDKGVRQFGEYLKYKVGTLTASAKTLGTESKQPSEVL